LHFREKPFVMAGLVPAIHVFGATGKKDVDARDKRGHDESWVSREVEGNTAA